MSIRVMTAVWDNGPEDSGELLVLLAMADFADDAGICWPSVATVAKKARMSDRNARRVIRKLEGDGYLRTFPSSGRKSNKYQILTTPDKLSALPQPGHLEHSTRTSATLNPDIAMSAKPSKKHKEPLRVSARAPDGARGPADEVRGPLTAETQAILNEFLRRDGAKFKAWKEAAE